MYMYTYIYIYIYIDGYTRFSCGLCYQPVPGGYHQSELSCQPSKGIDTVICESRFVCMFYESFHSGHLFHS